ncbi:MAG: HD-GYP domain-containing protein [Blastocatellia bacterium]
MQAQQALLTFTEVERPLGERLIKQAVEIDRIEGYTDPHSIAIARMAERLGAGRGLHGSDLTALKFAALAHDIGLRAMKRNYLLRPDGLTWEERLDLWRHPILGEQAAGELRLSRQAQLLIRWHHEAWNGQGYPDGLSGEAIPAGARILRVVDSYYALISRRPHRPAFDPLDAEQIVADLAGIEFDPRIVKQLLLALAEERKEREAASWPGAFGGPFDVESLLPDYEPEEGVSVVEAGERMADEAGAFSAQSFEAVTVELAVSEEVLEIFPGEPVEGVPPPHETAPFAGARADEPLPDLLEIDPAPEPEELLASHAREDDLLLTPLPAEAPADDAREPNPQNLQD